MSVFPCQDDIFREVGPEAVERAPEAFAGQLDIGFPGSPEPEKDGSLLRLGGAGRQQCRFLSGKPALCHFQRAVVQRFPLQINAHRRVADGEHLVGTGIRNVEAEFCIRRVRGKIRLAVRSFQKGRQRRTGSIFSAPEEETDHIGSSRLCTASEKALSS